MGTRIPMHYLKDPKLWELWYIPYYVWVMQGLYHPPYLYIPVFERLNPESAARPPRRQQDLVQEKVEADASDVTARFKSWFR